MKETIVTRQIVSIASILLMVASTSWPLEDPNTEGIEPSNCIPGGIDFMSTQRSRARIFVSNVDPLFRPGLRIEFQISRLLNRGYYGHFAPFYNITGGSYPGQFAPGFSMSHTLGMSLWAGPTSGTNQFDLYYLNTMTYRFSPKFAAVAQVGIRRSLVGPPSFGTFGSRGQEIVLNIDLLYSPNPNWHIVIHMSRVLHGRLERFEDRFYNRFPGDNPNPHCVLAQGGVSSYGLRNCLASQLKAPFSPRKRQAKGDRFTRDDVRQLRFTLKHVQASMRRITSAVEKKAKVQKRGRGSSYSVGSGGVARKERLPPGVAEPDGW